MVRSISPKKGPTIGGTIVTLLGIGFGDVFIQQNKEKLIFYKFIDRLDNVTQYGEIYNTSVSNSHMIDVVTPPVYKNNTQANIYISYNQENFENANEKLYFTYYVLPNITTLSSFYGPLKTEN